MKKLGKNKYAAMSFIEVLLAIVFLGIVGVVIAKFASNTMSRLLRDEKIEEATNYAINSDVEIQSIVNKKVVDKESKKELTGEEQSDDSNSKRKIFPEEKICNGYFYIVMDENNNPILAQDKNGDVMCAYGWEDNDDESVRRNCLENPAAYDMCVVKSNSGTPEFFRYIHIDFPDNYSFDETDFLLADITVGQITNQNNDVTSDNMINDYKYHTALKLTEKEKDHLITIKLTNATIKNSGYLEQKIEHGGSDSFDVSVSQYLKNAKCDLSCRGSADTNLNDNVVSFDDVLSDVECTIDCEEDPCANYDINRDCGNGVVECEEECDPPGVDNNCSSTCKFLCGNGILDEGEVCEKKNPSGAEYDWDDALCDKNTCKLACGNYTIEYCGNGKVEEDCGEVCDPLDPLVEGCSNVCEFFCGNGIIESGEDCEMDNPQYSKLKWEDPYCIQRMCKECIVKGTITILNTTPPTTRDLTEDEIKEGRVYLELLDLSKKVTVNGKDYKDLKYDDTKKSYYIEIVPFCESSVKVDLKIEYSIITGTVTKNSNSSLGFNYDIFLILDISGSMGSSAGGSFSGSRASVFATVVNDVLKSFIDNTDNRLGIVLFPSNTTSASTSSYSSTSFLQFGSYRTNSDGYFLKHDNNSPYGSLTYGLYTYKLYDSSGNSYENSAIIRGSTPTQSGIITSKQMMLGNSVNVSEKRKPVYILVTDGEANLATDENGNMIPFDRHNEKQYTMHVSFVTMQAAKSAKEEASKHYSVDANFFSMVLLPKAGEAGADLDLIKFTLDPSATNIKNYFFGRKNTYCDLIKSV